MSANATKRDKIGERINELLARSMADDTTDDGRDLDRVERSALNFLHVHGYTDQADTIHCQASDKERWAIWAADSIAWTICRIRAGEWREAVRGYGQIQSYKGHHGGFLPSGLSDHIATIQNRIESKILPR